MSSNYQYVLDKLQNDITQDKGIWIYLIIFAFVGSAFYAFKGFGGITVKTNLASVGPDLLMKYMFIVLAIERAAAVYVGTYLGRYQGHVDWEFRVSRLNDLLGREEPAIATLRTACTREEGLVNAITTDASIKGLEAPDGNTDSAEDYIAYLTAVKYIYEFRQARYNSVTRKVIARVVLIIAVVLSVIGVSLFSDVFEPLQEDVWFYQYQLILLKLGDIVITGGLLGGGSTGLNMLSNKIGDVVGGPAKG